MNKLFKTKVSAKSSDTQCTSCINTVMFFATSFVLKYICSLYVSKLTPVITTQDGKVQGSVAYSRDGKEYWRFVNIPYAEPPTGKLKFQPPVPIKPWNGIKMATGEIPFCIQFDAIVSQVVRGQEDCLYLNVYTPPIHNENGAKFPILVHFAGGGFFMSGSKLYGPDYLMDHSIIVVTFNYRLGPFGFLNFNHDPKIDGVNLPRGNMGLKDQLLVLKWVKNNIARFGGNPQHVSILGDSAGAASLHLHILSPKSRGLFHRAYSHSGTACVASNPRELAFEYARRVNCPLNDNRALLDCLENINPNELAKQQLSSTDPMLPSDFLFPSIEEVESDDRFLSDHPQKIVDSGEFSKVPYVLGVNDGDGGYKTGSFDALPTRIFRLRNIWKEAIANVLVIDDLSPSKAQAIWDFYFDDVQAKDGSKKFQENLTRLFSDHFIFEPVHRAAIGHAKSGAETYLLYFNYTSRLLPGLYSLTTAYNPNSWMNRYMQVGWNVWSDWIQEKFLGRDTLRPYGVGHAEETPQIWNVMGSKWLSGLDLEFSKTYVTMIANFVQGRSPLKFGNTEWPRVKANVKLKSVELPLKYMLIDNGKEGKVIPEPFANRVQFWSCLGVKSFNRLPTQQENCTARTYSS